MSGSGWLTVPLLSCWNTEWCAHCQWLSLVSPQLAITQSRALSDYPLSSHQSDASWCICIQADLADSKIETLSRLFFCHRAIGSVVQCQSQVRITILTCLKEVELIQRKILIHKGILTCWHWCDIRHNIRVWHNIFQSIQIISVIMVDNDEVWHAPFFIQPKHCVISWMEL